MIVKRTWSRHKNMFETYYYVGYFLFGFIPLFISRE